MAEEEVELVFGPHVATEVLLVEENQHQLALDPARRVVVDVTVADQNMNGVQPCPEPLSHDLSLLALEPDTSLVPVLRIVSCIRVKYDPVGHHQSCV